MTGPDISDRIIRILRKHGGVTKELLLAFFDGTYDPEEGETIETTERALAAEVLDGMIVAGTVDWSGVFCRLPRGGRGTP